MKHWLTKILGISLLAASTTLLLSACGSNQNSSNGTTTIEFFNQKKEMSTTLQQIVTDFEKKNPKIKVKVTNVPNPGDVLRPGCLLVMCPMSLTSIRKTSITGNGRKPAISKI